MARRRNCLRSQEHLDRLPTSNQDVRQADYLSTLISNVSRSYASLSVGTGGTGRPFSAMSRRSTTAVCRWYLANPSYGTPSAMRSGVHPSRFLASIGAPSDTRYSASELRPVYAAPCSGV